MNVPDRIRAWLARGTLKVMQSQGPLLPEWARTQFMNPTFKALCSEGVRANGIVFNCIETLVFAYPEPKLRIYQHDGEIVWNHPAAKLLVRPNPQMGMAELLQYVVLYKAIGGNCYLYKVRSAARRVVELWPLSDSQIVPVAGGTAMIDHYEWYDESQSKKIPIPADDIVHLKWMPDPLAPWRGIAPLQAVAREVDTDNEARRYLFALLKNDAIPRIAITMPSEKAMSVDDTARFHEMWRDRYGGANRGAPAVLGGGMDVKKIGLDLQELAFEALSRVPEARIAGAFRVPPVLAFLNVGLEQMTYNNVAGMRRQFTEGTLVPMWRMDADEIAADLLPEFGDPTGLTIAFDLNTVVALQEAVTEMRTWIDGAVTRGYVMVNEGRAKLGLPAVVDGDVFLRSLTTQVVPGQIAIVPAQKALSAPAEKLLLTAPIERKGSREQRRALALTLVAAQRQQREEVARRMEPALDGWFGGLADRVIGRAMKGLGGDIETKVSAGDLVTSGDDAELEAVVRRFVVELAQLSWQGWNLSLGVDVAFDLHDPAVTAALEGAGLRIKDINATTLAAVRDALQFGSEQGWGIDHIVRGDPKADPPVRGLRDVVEGVYKGRARAIARTELGTAQQRAAASRYRQAGVNKVLCLDNGFEDSHPACQAIGQGGKGTVVSIEWAEAHPLQHPNCVRCFAPEFDAEVDTGALSAWDTAGGDRQ